MYIYIYVYVYIYVYIYIYTVWVYCTYNDYMQSLLVALGFRVVPEGNFPALAVSDAGGCEREEKRRWLPRLSDQFSSWVIPPPSNCP